MNAMLNEIIQRPDLKIIVNELQEKLKEESKLRKEFYNTITEEDKAEFINGEVVMHSPVRRQHGIAMTYLLTLIRVYADKNDLGETDAEKRMIELTRNSYEPDIVFFKKEKAKHFTDEQVLFPAPDMIVEIISSTTENIDRGIKMQDYALHGVAEYWLIDPRNKTIEQYILQTNKYELEFKGKNGVVTSKVIEGFSIDTKAVFNKKENLRALQQLMQ